MGHSTAIQQWLSHYSNKTIVESLYNNGCHSTAIQQWLGHFTAIQQWLGHFTAIQQWLSHSTTMVESLYTLPKPLPLTTSERANPDDQWHGPATHPKSHVDHK